MSERKPTTCRHCGARIVPTKFLDREHWTHQPAGAAFMDGQYEFCKRTVATPLTNTGEQR